MPPPPPPLHQPPQSCGPLPVVAALPAANPAPSYFFPVPQDAYAVACRFHAVVTPNGEPPADFPGEAGADAPPLPCGSCGLPEVRKATLVCDGCERGFHLSCVRNRPRQLTLTEDWLCTECTASGRPKKRWTLGAAMLLDINALPPTEADEMEDSRGTGFRVNMSDRAHSMNQPRNIFELGKDAGNMDVLRTVSEDGMIYGQLHSSSQYYNMKASYSCMGVDERGDGSGVVRSMPLRRRKKDLSGTLPVAGLPDCQDHGRTDADPYSSSQMVLPQSSSVRGAQRASKPYMEENIGGASQYFDGLLPVQCEDFYVVTLGKIDMRLAYHDGNHIWPVGYRAIWHDKLTGSIFECEVADGGNDGPVFRVRRYPCSDFPIPIGLTVISHNSNKRTDFVEQAESSNVTMGAGVDTEDEILSLLSDPSQSDQEFLSCFSSNMVGSSCGSPMQMNVYESYVLTDRLDHSNEKLGQASDVTSVSKDEIGEFYVEGRSSSSVWKMVSQTFTDACRDLYRRLGSLKFYCSHESKILPSYSDEGNKEYVDDLGPLTRFCCFSGPNTIERVIQCDSELVSACNLLAEWLKEDRFGLNMDFVQEIIEILPGSHSCSGYRFLNNRAHFPTSLTVANRRLIAVQKKGRKGEEQLSGYNLYKRQAKLLQRDFVPDPYLYDHQPPPGKALSTKLPTELIGDVFQIWEFLWRFYDVLGLKEPPSFEELEEELIDPWPISSNMEELEKEIQCYRDSSSQLNENLHTRPSMSSAGPDLTASELSPYKFVPTKTASVREAAQAKLASRTYGRCYGATLTKIHISLLKVLIQELSCKVAGPTTDSREPRTRRRRKKDTDNSIPPKETKNDILIANELTWPELTRRYILSIICMKGAMDSSDGISRESMKLFRCLQGDGGVLCGSLTGIAGMEADALLLAEAERQISDCRKQESTVVLVDHKDSDDVHTSEPAVVDVTRLPDWAKPLEPVKKLPTNVGTRIRKCIYEALDKNPPEWAKKILEHSISKEVYKGNASGPTKKAVLSVLAEAYGGRQVQKPGKKRQEKSPISLPDAIMKKCRVILRRVTLADEEKVFCNLLGRVIANVNDGEDEGILGFPGMVSCPMDFRTVDLRLAVGAYGGSHEAFAEDVREVWRNICTAYGEQSDHMELVEMLSQEFDSLYEKEVLSLAQKVATLENTDLLASEKQKELHDLILTANDIPKAPWEEGVCKVCGIDKDDDSVLLCDICDSEYHTYCLNPPLARIPQGDWYCASCIKGQSKTFINLHTHPIKHKMKRCSGQEYLNQLAIAMEEREYWELSGEERISLLRFLCEEVLSTGPIREHLEQCTDKSNELQQRLRSLASDMRILKFKEEVVALNAAKEKNKLNVRGVKDDGSTISRSDHSGLTGHWHNVSSNLNSPVVTSGNPLKRTSSVSIGSFEEGGQSDLSKNIEPMSIEAHISHAAQTGDRHSSADIIASCNVLSESIIHKQDQVSGQENMLTDGGGIRWKDDALSGSNTPGASGRLFTPIERASRVITDNVHSVLTETGCNSLNLGALKDEISCLQGTIFHLEYQLMMSSLRRDFLGRDSFGRLYWAISRPGKRPWLIADGSMSATNKRNAKEFKSCVANRFQDMDSSCSMSASDFSKNCPLPFTHYESDKEIEELARWLSDIDSVERELKECILQWRRLLYQQDIISASTDFESRLKSSPCKNYAIPPNLAPKAVVVLEARYGPFWEPEVFENPKKKGKKTRHTVEERMYRCDCLEPVWPSRLHCLSCHQSFSTAIEFEGHNDGKCTASIPSHDENKENDELVKGKGPKSESVRGKESHDESVSTEIKKSDTTTNHLFSRKSCPFDLDEISKTFLTNDSNKELVQGIGLIGSNGAPSFVPSPVCFADTAFVLINPMARNDLGLNGELAHMEGSSPRSVVRISSNVGDDIKEAELESHSAQNYGGNGIDVLSQKVKDSTPDEEEASSVWNKMLQSGISHGSMVSESSLKPLVGKISEILKRLKINLLDMEAALSIEAIKASKSHCRRRCAWRTFVKSAESIFEMVQASILFEDMIKTEYLKNGWWYWSSKTAAAKTATVSSLALRIYTLDDCIIYVKDLVSGSGPVDSLKKIGKKRKDADV